MRYCGKCHKFGDNINTDYIISSRRKRDSVDPAYLARYLMEDISPGFGGKVARGDIIVGGRNFGCGSAMEVATEAIRAAGIEVVVAESFARTFYRNGFNGGLCLVECPTAAIADGDCLEVQVEDDGVVVTDGTSGVRLEARPIPVLMRGILASGGLINHLKKHGDFGVGR